MSFPETENKTREAGQGTSGNEPEIKSEEIRERLGIDGNNKGQRRKKLIYGILIFLALVVAYWGWKSWGVAQQPNYITETINRGDLILKVTATGDLQAVNTVEVGSEISGLIKSVFVDYNDQVITGQVLARLDTDRLEAEVSQARASLQAAQATLAQAQASLDEQLTKTTRSEELARQNLISPQDLESARAALSRARATVESASAQIIVNQASLDMAETTLSKASIESPINGVVLTRNIRPGQAVAASFQTPVLFTLAEDLTRMELHVDVDEADISQVKEGQQATFTVDAYPDTSFPATITKVYYAPQTVADVVTYEAILSVDNTGMLLRPGMTATTEIVTRRINEALLLPNSALRFTPPGEQRRAGDETTIWILKEGTPEAVNVKTGPTDDLHTQLLVGDLQPGEEVLTNIEREE